MNPEITLDDYREIGTMETALSEHADEAFFELSAEGQKIAEKIFKCLTETDRENREIRRATTVEKLCAVSEADFSEVAAVIEVFRKEGRTFLMPPPEVALNKNSLIDISHESLIRKWERLKKWVEEEGQSSRTYRRLAEDALLHQQKKMGFWSDPELKDALEWRENFKPNETWAQLYKETGERQYKASFAESMQYLDESETKRDEEIAEDERQQDALKSYAAKLRWLVVGLVILLLASFGVTVYAFYKRAETIRINDELQTEQNATELALNRLKESQYKLDLEQQEKDKAFNDLNKKTGELESKRKELGESLKIQKAATKKAEDEKVRADNEARQAILSEEEKQKALVVQEQLAVKAKDAKFIAEQKQKEAEDALAEAQFTTKRVEINRSALVFLEQGELKLALPKFEELLKHYEDESEKMPKESRNDGKWWTLHNLGIVYSKMPNTFPDKFINAECSYNKALNVLGENVDVRRCPKTQSQNSGQYFQQFVSYQNSEEINRNKVTTLRRLAQLYRVQADDAANDDDWRKFLLLAIKKYDRLLEIQRTEKKQPDYMVDIYVELADCLSDSPVPEDYPKAKELYKKADETYGVREEYGKQVDVLRKWADAARSRRDGNTAVVLLKKAIEIQEDENKMDLSPVNLEIADSYAQLAKADELRYEIATHGQTYYNPPPYAKLSESISKVNYAANKTDYLSTEDVRNLANTYIEVRKCRRAEKVYEYAIDRSRQPSRQGEFLRDTFRYLYFYVDLAELYQNVLNDDKKAQEKFDVFVANSEKYKSDGETRFVTFELFEKAGDFYLAKDNYLQAGKFYEYALQIIEKDKRQLESGVRIISNELVEKDLTKLILHNAEVLVKAARVDETQNKLAEAEAKYPLAINVVAKKFGATDIATVRVLIYQADFYGRRGNKEKATEIYYKAYSLSTAFDKFPAQQLTLQIQIQKGLGDINRNDTTIAAGYYEKAISNLKKFMDIQTGTGEECAKKGGSAEEVIRYTKNGKATEEYWIDKTEILESWANLKGVENAAKLKKEAQEAQEAANEVKTNRCYEDKPE